MSAKLATVHCVQSTVVNISCPILNPFNIREKLEICERKDDKKNLPNVGGENAAKVAGQKYGKA